jgi:DNA-binding transcriptional MerR regulator
MPVRTMSERTEKTYSLKELAALAEMSPRTIHSYVQMDLLEGVGKRGPGTRYPARYLDRLLFIKRLREETRLTLKEIGELLRNLAERDVSLVAHGETPTWLERLTWEVTPPTRLAFSDVRAEASRKGRFSRLRSLLAREESPDEPAPEASMDQAFSSMGRLHDMAVPEPPEERPRPRASRAISPSLSDLLVQLRRLAGPGRVPVSRRSENWVSVPVTDNLRISARGLEEGDVAVLERIADHLRTFLGLPAPGDQDE